MHSKLVTAGNQPRIGHKAAALMALWGLLLAPAALAAVASPGGLVTVEHGQDMSRVVYVPGPGLAAREVHLGPGPLSDPGLRRFETVGLVEASWLERRPEGERSFVSVSRDDGHSWSRPQQLDFGIELRAGGFVPGETLAPAVERDLAARSSNQLYLVQFELMSLEPFRQTLSGLGAELLWPVPNHAHLVRMGARLAEQVSRLDFVRWVGPMHPGYRVDPLLLGGGGPAEPDVASRVVIQVARPGPDEKHLVAEEVGALGGEVVKLTPNGTLLEAVLTRSQLMELAHSNRVLWIEPWGPPGEDMNIARDVSGATFALNNGGYDGTGVRGEVMDGGLDQDHPDFPGVIIHGFGGSFPEHGTCTYGIVFGQGNQDATGTGLLPAAQGYFSGYEGLFDRYAHTRELVRSPINAVFQSNSWGSALTGSYTSVSSEMDDIIWESDILIFQSMSNWGSNQFVRPQAWAKNIVSVGGVLHRDTASLLDDCWCGGASIGPAADGRIKPDLTHFFDWIYTTDAEPGGYAFGNYTPDFGGTSGATPIVAGLGGLVFQMWADDILGNEPQGATVFEKRPHAATAKAIMINTAYQYPFSGTFHDKARVNQGWGLPNVQNFLERAPLMKVVDEESPLQDLQVDTWRATVPIGQSELKATLVYTDRAGAAFSGIHRINDLSLKVVNPAGGAMWGNVGLDTDVLSAPGDTPDNRNTVENVFIDSPVRGDWTIEVHAHEINQDQHTETPEVDQDYALVVYGVESLTKAGASDLGVVSGAPGPLVGIKAGDQARFSWGADCASGTVYGLYGGDLALGYASLAPVAGQCDIADTTVDIPVAGSGFFLVAPNDGAEEGSLGLVSPGVRRPQPAAVCYPRADNLNPCAP